MNTLSDIFVAIASCSWRSSWLILAVLIAHPLVRGRVPWWTLTIAWMVVAYRLLIPFGLPIRPSLHPWVQPVSSYVTTQLEVDLPSAAIPRFEFSSPPTKAGAAPSSAVLGRSKLPFRTFVVRVCSIIWVLGVGTLLAARLWALKVFRGKLRASSSLSGDERLAAVVQQGVRFLRKGKMFGATRQSPLVIEAEFITTPGCFGLFRPHLIFPRNFVSRLTDEELRFVVLHELGHWQQRHLLAHVFMQCGVLVHWFNPLAWLAAWTARKDFELACDAFVLRKTSSEEADRYGAALLKVAGLIQRPKGSISVLGIFERKRELKERIQMIANYRRPGYIGLVGGVALLLSFLGLSGTTGSRAVAQPEAPLISREAAKETLPKSDGYWPTNGWKTSAPEEQGMSSPVLAKLIEYGKSMDLDSILVARHGKMVLDAYYAPYTSETRHNFYGANEGVIGTLVAIALHTGKLESIDRPVLDYFPEKKIADLTDAKKAIRIRNLLDMTSGFDWKEAPLGAPASSEQMARSADWVQFVLDRPMAERPGAVFNMNAGHTNLLSAILTKETGFPALTFAYERLFKPLGIYNVSWRTSPQGNNIGGWGFYITPRDMAKIGYLYLRNGRWEGKQLFSPSWIDRLRDAPSVMDEKLGVHYANLLWIFAARHAYVFAGVNSQLLIILPDQDLVAVTTGRLAESTGRRNENLPILIQNIIDSVKSERALPPDKVSQGFLASRVAEVGIEEPPSGIKLNAAVGKHYRLMIDKAGSRSRLLPIAGFVLKLKGDHPSYDLGFEGRNGENISVTGPVGLDGESRQATDGYGGTFASKGAWIDSATFEMYRRALDDGVTAKFIFRFSGDEVDLEFTDTVGNHEFYHGNVGG